MHAGRYLPECIPHLSWSADLDTPGSPYGETTHDLSQTHRPQGGSAMPTFDVSGISDWPEDRGSEFAIFKETDFRDEREAVAAAHAAYSPDLEVVVRQSSPDTPESSQTHPDPLTDS
jgi:hypothetical protein